MDRHWIFKIAFVSLAVILLLTDCAESCRRRRRRRCHNCRSGELVGAVSGKSRYTCNNGYSHGSRCLFHCEKSGYSRCTRKNYCYTCQCDGNWSPKPINSECCDVRRPSISCPDDITVRAEPPSKCVFVTWSIPPVTDNSGEAITARRISGLPPGSSFCEGETKVRYTATDRAGNSKECSFTVTVDVPRTPSCPPLEERPPASLIGCNFVDEAPIGKTCSWQCPNTHSSVGNRAPICTATESWDNDNFKCEPLRCPTLNAMSPRHVSCSGNIVGSTCKWSCKNGYRSKGTSTSTCLITRSWDLLNFECEEISCNSLREIHPAYHTGCNHSTITVQGTDPVGSVCKWQCRTGFYGVGYSKCLPDGSWNNTAFECTAVACPDLDVPTNGSLACDTTVSIKFCFINCQAGSDIPLSVSRNSNFDQPYVCDAGVWNKIYKVPNCTATSIPRRILDPVELYYYSDQSCNDENTIEEIKLHFKSLIIDSMYGTEYCRTNNCDDKNVDVQNVEVTCGASKRKRRQVRRAADETTALLLTDASKLLKYGKREKRLTNILNKIKWNRDNDDPKLQASSINKRNSRYEFTVAFDVTMEFHPSEGGDAVDESWEAVDNLYAMMGDLYSMIEDGMMVPEMPGVESRLQDGFPMNYWDVEVGPVCDPGYVEASTSLLCSPCFEGTFNTNAECQGCPIGTYQDQLAQTSCKACPSGKSTIGTGSSNLSDCKDLCLPGEYSATGLAPCIKCSIGFYQSDERGTECILCPDESSTLQIGSQNCIAKCLPGSYSATGFYPCDECSLNYYQPESGQTECISCPDNLITNLKGAVNEIQCVEVQGGCVSYPCMNNARCLHYGYTAYYCVCDNGWDGQDCSSYNGANCGGTWIEPNGVLTSPNYPDHYRSRDQCAYFIKVPGAEQITFSFTDFESEIHKDRLAYGSGNTVDTALEWPDYIEGNLTTNNMLPDQVSIAGDNVWFDWYTDKNIEQRGFRLVYTACLHQDLPSVQNGEFFCSNAECSVKCDKGFGIRKGKTTVYKCSGGTWTPSNPAEIICESAKMAIGFEQTSDATLDSNMDCNEMGYKENFTEGVYTYLNSTIFGEACDGKCFFDDLKFTCFQSGGAARRKRQAQTPVEFLITMAITLNVDLNEAITMDEVYEDAEEMNFIMKKIVREIEDGTFLEYVASNTTMETIPDDEQPVGIGEVVPICEAGYSRTASTFICIPCEVGTFESDGECFPCPEGQIQPYQGQTLCFPIPEK